MFESLSERLQGIFRSLRGQGVLSEAQVDAALREIRLDLLEADVHFKVAKQIVDRVLYFESEEPGFLQEWAEKDAVVISMWRQNVSAPRVLWISQRGWKLFSQGV